MIALRVSVKSRREFKEGPFLPFFFFAESSRRVCGQVLFTKIPRGTGNLRMLRGEDKALAAAALVGVVLLLWRYSRRAGSQQQPVRQLAGNVIALYKPYNTLCSFVDEAGARGRTTLLTLNLPAGLVNVGRLDRDSEGLLLLTDDGVLCNRVLQGGVSKRYHVLVAGTPSDAALAAMGAGGLCIRGRATRPCRIRRLEYTSTEAGLPGTSHVASCNPSNSTWLEFTLEEGMNRQIRRTTLHSGHRTLRLVRMGVGTLQAEQLALQPGEWMYVEPHDILPDT
jgi:23S rRNA pseudouridine2457 synthase